MNDFIVTGIIFVIAMVLFILWQPTRLLLREIFLHPFKDSVFLVTDKKVGEKPNNDARRTGDAVEAKP